MSKQCEIVKDKVQINSWYAYMQNEKGANKCVLISFSKSKSKIHSNLPPRVYDI